MVSALKPMKHLAEKAKSSVSNWRHNFGGVGIFSVLILYQNTVERSTPKLSRCDTLMTIKEHNNYTHRESLHQNHTNHKTTKNQTKPTKTANQSINLPTRILALKPSHFPKLQKQLQTIKQQIIIKNKDTTQTLIRQSSKTNPTSQNNTTTKHRQKHMESKTTTHILSPNIWDAVFNPSIIISSREKKNRNSKPNITPKKNIHYRLAQQYYYSHWTTNKHSPFRLRMG